MVDLLNDYFAELEAKGIRLSEGQKSWYVKKAEILGDSIKKEYPSTPDEAFEVNTDGLYYAKQISIARAQKRILNIPFDRTLKVHTAWDLGFTDATTIVFFQLAGKEIHIIDFLEGTGKSLADYIKIIRDKDYIYGTHVAPHDIKVHEFSSGRSRLDTATKLGVAFSLCHDLGLAEGIDAVRNAFPKLFFHNSDAVLKLVKHLENYSQVWDKSLGQWSGRPSHDGHSHAADAMRYMVLGIDLCIDESQSMSQKEAEAAYKQYGRKL